jgi:Outer membrane protein beta-barrel domain
MRLIQKMYVVALVCMVCLSCAVRAQVLQGSKDAGVSIAFNGKGGIDGKIHPSFGLSGSYNWRRNLAAVGEFEYVPFGSTLAFRQTIQLAGGGARYYFLTSPRVAPYVTATGGFARFATNTIGTGTNISEKDGYWAVGGGASFYINESFGVRPEVRMQDEFVGLRYPFKEVQGSISVFYQFGGSSTTPKSATPKTATPKKK